MQGAEGPSEGICTSLDSQKPSSSSSCFSFCCLHPVCFLKHTLNFSTLLLKGL